MATGPKKFGQGANYTWVGGGMEEVRQWLGPCGQIQVTYIEDECVLLFFSIFILWLHL